MSRMPSNQPCCRLFDPREIAPPLVKRFLVASLFSLPSSSFSLPCNFRSQLPYPLFLSHPLLLPPPNSFTCLIQISTKHFLRQFLRFLFAPSYFLNSSPSISHLSNLLSITHCFNFVHIFDSLSSSLLSCPCSNFSILVSFQGNILLLLLVSLSLFSVLITLPAFSHLPFPPTLHIHSLNSSQFSPSSPPFLFTPFNTLHHLRVNARTHACVSR